MNDGESGSGLTALHIAVRQESERVVTALLAAGADPSVADTANADTPLHMAASRQEAVILVSADTPLHMASSRQEAVIGQSAYLVI